MTGPPAKAPASIFTLCALLVGACTALLGDDFEVVAPTTTGGAGGSGAGAIGGGGVGGGAGGEAPPAYDCTWQLTFHREVQSLEGQPDGHRRWVGDLEGIALEDDLRVFVEREEVGIGRIIDLYTVDENNTRHFLFDDGHSVEDVKRLAHDRVGVLTEGEVFVGAGGNNAVYRPQLRLRVVLDSDSDGTQSQVFPVTDAHAFDDVSTQEPRLRARFAPTGGNASPADIGVMVTYQGQDGWHRDRYGHFTGSPMMPVLISPPGAQINEDDAHPQALVHLEGTTYVFLGEPGGTIGMREYVLAHPVTGEVEARTFEPPTLTAIDALPRPGGEANLAIASLQNPLQLFVGRLSAAELGTFEPSSLILVSDDVTVANLPVVAGAVRWGGDLLIFFGTRQGAPQELAIHMYDARGYFRGAHDLPFTLTVPDGQTRGSIVAAVAVVSDPLFDTIGGVLQVAWIEERYNNGDPGGMWHVMYYDQLSCYLPAE